MRCDMVDTKGTCTNCRLDCTECVIPEPIRYHHGPSTPKACTPVTQVSHGQVETNLETFMEDELDGPFVDMLHSHDGIIIQRRPEPNRILDFDQLLDIPLDTFESYGDCAPDLHGIKMFHASIGFRIALLIVFQVLRKSLLSIFKVAKYPRV